MESDLLKGFGKIRKRISAEVDRAHFRLRLMPDNGVNDPLINLRQNEPGFHAVAE